jgi:polysaccharide biosynthesis transport protein
MDDFAQRSSDHLQYEHRSAELELTFVDVVMFLWRYRYLIAACVIIGAGLAVAYVTLATPIFTAKAQVLIESRMPVTFREQVSETIATLDTPAVESQIAILQSENIAEKVVRKAGLLDEHPVKPSGFSFNPFGWLRSLLATAQPEDPVALKEEEHARLREAITQLWSSMEVSRLGLSHVIEISYSASNRDLAAKVTNLIADAYIEDQLETRAETAKQGSIWLEKRIDTLRQQMNEAGLRVKEFKAKRDYRFPSSSGQSEPRVGPDGAAEPPGTADEQPTTSLEDLESRASTYRKIYESYLQAYTESVQAQSYPVTNTRIITRATRPNGRSSPRAMKVLAIAIALGGVFGVGIALLLTSFGRSRLSRA